MRRVHCWRCVDWHLGLLRMRRQHLLVYDRDSFSGGQQPGCFGVCRRRAETSAQESHVIIRVQAFPKPFQQRSIRRVFGSSVIPTELAKEEQVPKVWRSEYGLASGRLELVQIAAE